MADKADGPIADDGDDTARLDPSADRGVVARAHHVRQREQRRHRLVGVLRARDPDERGVGEGHRHGLAPAAVDGVGAEHAAGDAAHRPAGEAVRARAVVVEERGMTRSPSAMPRTSEPTCSTTPMNS